MAEEIRLLQASIDGDAGAFEEIVKKYQSLICAITFSGTGRVDVSEELAQETFLNAWKSIRQLRELSGFRPWLCTIARNMLHNYYRQRKMVSLESADIAEIADQAQTPSETLICQEEHLMLEKALMGMPPEYREPLVMYYRQQQSVREVAVGLGLNESTVRTRLSRAREMLREEVAVRLEQTLERTAPGKAFTKAVMVAVGGAAIGLSASASATTAAANAAGTTASSGISAVMSTVTAKIITAAAVVAVVVGAVVIYSQSPQASRAKSAATSNEIAIVQDKQKPVEVSKNKETAELGTQDIDGTQIDNPPKNTNVSQNNKDTGPQPESGDRSQAVMVSEEKSQTGIQGTVFAKGTSQSIKGAKLFTDRKGKKILAETNAQGCFEIFNMKPQVQCRIYIVAPHYTSRQFTTDIIQDKVYEDFKIELSPCYQVTGTVYDPNQNPVAGATVATFQFTNVPAVTDHDGNYTIDGLDPSWRSYQLHVMHSEYPAISVALESANAGETVIKNFTISLNFFKCLYTLSLQNCCFSIFRR